MEKMLGKYIVTTVTAEAMLLDEISQDTKMTGDIARVIHLLKDNCEKFTSKYSDSEGAINLFNEVKNIVVSLSFSFIW